MVSRQDDHGSNVFLSDSLGLATGALGTLFLALKLGETSRIASIDKLSVGLVVLFSVPFFGKPNRSVKKRVTIWNCLSSENLLCTRSAALNKR